MGPHNFLFSTEVALHFIGLQRMAILRSPNYYWKLEPTPKRKISGADASDDNHAAGKRTQCTSSLHARTQCSECILSPDILVVSSEFAVNIQCLFTSLASLSHKFCFGIISPPRKAGPKQELWFENDDFGYLRR